MKKASLVIVTLTLVCCAFAGGFFLGRNTSHHPITVSVIPTTAKDSQGSNEDPTQLTNAYPIDINTATTEEFSSLPGIGDTLAQRIVAYREEKGPFQSLADLLNVEGIGEKKLEAILEFITIGGHP